ncbi:phosphatidylserine decarboxylase-domain-containing protein [Lipomyces oligophaga]|uniref:phosphatidylserine decarboxylase-domain-containing protein n=1 Tax=Lipomyces oligophaga TaxID=45792 RepID=UPI0034CE9F90
MHYDYITPILQLLEEAHRLGHMNGRQRPRVDHYCVSFALPFANSYANRFQMSSLNVLKLASIIGPRSRSRSRSHSRSNSRSKSKSDSAGPDPAPALSLNVEIIKARGLAARDRGGTSDPFVVIQLGEYKIRSQTIPKTLNPEWNARYSIAIYPYQSDLTLSGVVWDQDRFVNDYLGSFEIDLVDHFRVTDPQLPVINVPENKPHWIELYSEKSGKEYVTGALQIRLSLQDSETISLSNEQILEKWMSISKFAVRPVFESAEDSTASLVDPDSTPSLKRSFTTSYRMENVHNMAGVVFLEVLSVNDLPPERNATRTGFDMDPYVVISFGKNVARTGIAKHSLNPIYNEKMLFSVGLHEQAYSFNIDVVDRDSFTNNDFVARTIFALAELAPYSPKLDQSTGLYKLPMTKSSVKQHTLDFESGFHVFDIPLSQDKENQYNPVVHIRAKYMPYPALRQELWRHLLVQFDDDESGMISRTELGDMLDYLGATLHSHTIDSFWLKSGLSLDEDLTIDQAVICLDARLAAETRSNSVAKSIPIVVEPQDAHDAVPDANGHVITEETMREIDSKLRELSTNSVASADSTVDQIDHDTYFDEFEEQAVERMIKIKECPVCHEPRMDRNSDINIISHIATCISQDWKSVDLASMNSYVTSAQAQRNWVGNTISRISFGNYKLGANSANILVQDRITGIISEERMSPYVRLGIRLLYKGLRSKEMERKNIRRILASLSIKQGIKYDDPKSAKSIRPFINFHKLDMSQVLLPIESFKTFNDFFYRELKPGARPCIAPDNPKIVTSPADCRSVVFDDLTAATNIWVKGKSFSIARLFGSAYPDDVESFIGGSFGIFRLAPQDYHRFHIPVDGIMGKPKTIEGAYYTVNPMAIRSELDVYGDNIRVLVPIDSDQFGRVMVVCVGAMMVGSTVITAKEGQRVCRSDQLGYFKFGGSTILVLFQHDRMNWDSDLTTNSSTALETLIQVGMSVGHSTDEPEFIRSPIIDPDSLSSMQREEARRRIEGSMFV